MNKTIKKVVERVGLKDKIKSKDLEWSPSHLSGGEAQRLALARAIICDPELIFVDEPTTFMNEELVYETTKILSEQVERGATVIIVTHHYNKLLHYFNRLAYENKKGKNIDRFFLREQKGNRGTLENWTKNRNTNENDKIVLIEQIF